MPELSVTNNPGIAPYTIMMNTQKGPTADINVRKAIAYAFDYEALITIHKGDAVLLDSPFPKVTSDHIKVDMPRQDLARAKDYLAKSAHAAGGLELEYCHVAGNEIQRQIGLILLSSVQPLGIKIKMVGQPWATLTGRGAAPETAADMSAAYVTPVTTSPDTIASQYASSAAGQYWGMHHLRDKEIDRMVAAAAIELDQTKRSELYGALQRRIVELQPAIFGMAANQRWAMHKYVGGFDYCPLMLLGEVDLYTLYVKT
jgi:peptide/nickel transport system substrate-binding protein